MLIDCFLCPNGSGGGSQNAFSTFSVSGQSDVVADSTTDILTFAAGSNVTITTNASTDTITISATGGGGGSGDTWSDPVDANIVPDSDSVRSLGSNETRFSNGYIDAIIVTNNITVGGTVDGRDIASDGSKLDGIESGADVTDAANVDAAGSVMESDYNANTILKADTDNTPTALTVAEQTLIGRITSVSITGLTATQVRTLLNVGDGAEANTIESDPTGITGADQITNIVSLTQAEYDAITPNASTLYIIT